MMKAHAEERVDALFAAWNEDRQSESPKSLEEWLRLYPEHAESLVAWTADTPVLDCAEQQVVPALERRAQEIGRQVVAEMRARYEAAPALTSLLDAAKARGLSPKTLAERLGVGVTIVAKLQQRLILTATLPAELLQRLADALQVSAEQMRAYLGQPAALARGASYKSDTVPQVTAQEDFAEAVRACREMTEEQKALWLS